MSGLKTIKFLDRFLGNVICFFLSLFNIKKPIKKIKPKKILIIQLWGIGESILTLPTISELKKHLPKSKISILLTKRNQDVYFNNHKNPLEVSYPQPKGWGMTDTSFYKRIFRIQKRAYIHKLKHLVLARFPYKNLSNQIILSLNPISIILFIVKNFKKYDLIIDMEEYLNISAIIAFFTGKNRIGYSHNIRAKAYTETVRYNDKQHTSQTFTDLLKPLGIKKKIDSLIRLNYSKNDKNNVDSLLKKSKITKRDFLVGIVPGAAESGRSRMWPKENYAKLVEQIIKKKKNAKVIFTGSDKEKQLIEDIINKIEINNKIKNKNKRIFNLAGKITLRELFYLTENLDIVISNDTGTMHIAAAMNTKTIGLFGPNLPVRFSPLNKKSKSIYKGKICKYSPCINVHKGQVPDCYYKGKDYQKCMKEISVGDVLKLL